MTTHDSSHSRRSFIQYGAGVLAGSAVPGLVGCASTSGIEVAGASAGASGAARPADLVVRGGRLLTMDPVQPEATALAARDGVFVAVGDDADVAGLIGPDTRVVDADRARVIPGLNDSHIHFVRQGMNYAMEVRWDGVDSLERGLEMIREQAARTPKGQWIRVIGGFSWEQFRERRMPTLEEVNEVAPDHPVFILYLYAYALLNRRAVEYLGYDSPNAPVYPGGRIERRGGRATGAVFADPSGLVLYKSISNGPKLSLKDQINSSLHYQREMHSFGVTSCSDCGGGGMVYPTAYSTIGRLHEMGQLKVRTTMYTFPQVKGEEASDYRRWTREHQIGEGDEMLRLGGAGENICWASYDFEIFAFARPDIDRNAEEVQAPIMRTLAEAGWPTRQHMTYDETISRLLPVYEEARQAAFGSLDSGAPLIIDHAETVSERNLERIARMGGIIGLQNRIIYQAEDFRQRYGLEALQRTPPMRRMKEMGLTIAAGTDATRVSSHNPWLSVAWLADGKSLGGLQMYGDENLLDRREALEAWTVGSAASTGDLGRKGRLAVGELADFAILDRDVLRVADDQLRDVRSNLTAVGGEIVYGAGPFEAFDGPALPVISPTWSPVAAYGGFQGG